MTTCRTCQRRLADDRFYPSRPGECKECRKAYTAAKRNADPETTRRYAREAYRRKRAEVIAALLRVCEYCDSDIPADRAAHSKFCSRPCALLAQEVRESEARRQARAGRLCANCGEEIPSNRSVRSKTCSAKCTFAMNELQQMHRRCRKLSHYALQTGRLIPEPCEVCGSWDVEMHHVDYMEPLSVRWFCFLHHRTVMHGQQVVDRS